MFLNGYVVTVWDMGGAAALPHFYEWLRGDNAKLGEVAMETLIVFGSWQPQLAKAAMPEILKNSRLRTISITSRISPNSRSIQGHAGPEVAGILLSRLEKYHHRSTDPAEIEKLARSPWSRYGVSRGEPLIPVLHALQTMGGVEVGEAAPALLAIYEEEPMETEWTTKCRWIRELRL